MRLLIGYDGSDGAEAAVDDLRYAGLPGGIEVLVLSVAEVWSHLPPAILAPTQPEADQRHATAADQVHALAHRALVKAQEMAHLGADKVRSIYEDWDVKAEVRTGSPAQELIIRASEWWADLVVVGAHSHTPASRPFLGSVAQKLLHYSECPVRIGRCLRNGSEPRPARLIIGMDGSPGAMRAVSTVASRTWPDDSEAEVVVASDVVLSTIMPVLGEDTGPVWTQHAALAAVSQLRDAGLDVTPCPCEGDPKKVLVQEADRWAADCLFVGARGNSRIERFLLGSVAEAVACRANCSVEVVRRPIRGDQR